MSTHTTDYKLYKAYFCSTFKQVSKQKQNRMGGGADAAGGPAAASVAPSVPPRAASAARGPRLLH